MSTLLIGCMDMPDLAGRSVSTSFEDTGDTRLGRLTAPLVHAHPDKSGVFALTDGRSAFAARALLARAAERSIDVQYYIWRHDMSGTLLFEELHDAADRGVRVRLLLDDNNTTGLDPILSMLDAHPSIEVRLFNPFMHRRFRALGFLTDFARLNRRMHNKSFTLDNQVTIIGGRNVGDEYFGASEELLFVDLDVMAIGPVVNEVSRDFDRYWASDSSYPVDRILPRIDPRAIAALSSEASLIERNPAAAAYTEAIATLPFVRDLQASRLPLEWTTARMISDDPAKGLGRAPAQRGDVHRGRALRGCSHCLLRAQQLEHGRQPSPIQRNWVEPDGQEAARIRLAHNFAANLLDESLMLAFVPWLVDQMISCDFNETGVTDENAAAIIQARLHLATEPRLNSDACVARGSQAESDGRSGPLVVAPEQEREELLAGLQLQKTVTGSRCAH